MCREQAERGGKGGAGIEDGHIMDKVIQKEMKRDGEEGEEKKKNIRRTHLTAAFWKG